ncbi:putative HORMA domain superfamily protein [Helianthus annuus]|nr:putative HORMA domain superfamily protein [Helianthus annuus]
MLTANNDSFAIGVFDFLLLLIMLVHQIALNYYDFIVYYCYYSYCYVRLNICYCCLCLFIDRPNKGLNGELKPLIMAVNPHLELAKMEQIITEFFAKSLHIILESWCPFVSSRNYNSERLYSPSSSTSSFSNMRPRDKWFNLALRDCPSALENIDFWRQSNLEPMVVDVVLVQRPVNWDSARSSPKVALERNLSSKDRFLVVWRSDSDEFGCDGYSEKIIERWIVQYDSKKGGKETSSGNKRPNSTSSHALYKKSILLLRSLYVTVRLLPAYKIFREINSSRQIRSFSLIHMVSSSVEPLTRRDGAEMQPFTFTPVDTSNGKLCVSQLYLPSISNTTSESSTPMSPQFIPDYVGSPLADPLKRLPSLPMPQYSPSSSPFGRRHSWSYDASHASPPSALPSPSPTLVITRLNSNKNTAMEYVLFFYLPP